MLKIFIVAGEPSADMHGASIARELINSRPDLRIMGVGGKAIQAAGVETLADITQYAVIGFWEAIKKLRVFKKIFNFTFAAIKKHSPHAVVLIDFPGFNLRLAKRIKKKLPQTKIVYYISPQVWAWNKKRVKLIKQIVDKMIVVFEFEKIIYEQEGMDVAYVGHPLLDIVRCDQKKEKLLNELDVKEKDNLIALLPGSREVEVKRILPLMLNSAKLLSSRMPSAKFILIKANNIQDQLLNNIMNQYRFLNIKIVNKNIYDFLHACTLAWVCSGTATLETALITTPMLIIYKTSFLTWFVSKLLIQLPYIGLVNIVAQEKIVPEFIQYQATTHRIAEYSLNFLKQKPQQQLMKDKLEQVKQKLGQPGANKRTAKIILDMFA